MPNYKFIFKTLLVLVIWQFFHFSLDALRFDPRFFWPGIVIILVLLSLITKEKFLINRYIISVLTVLVYILLSSINSIYFSSSLYSLMLLSLYFLTAFFISNKQNKLQFMKTLLVLASLHLIYISVQIFIPNIFYSIFDILSLETSLDAYNNSLRNAYRGFTGQTSISAFYYAVGLIVSLSLLKYLKTKKVVTIALAIFFFFAIIMTNRRGTFSIAILLMILFYMFSIQSNKKLLFLVVLVPIIIIIGVENLPGMQAILDKFNVYLSADNITSGRLVLWDNAIKTFRSNMFWGTGWLSYNRIFNVTSAHNSYLQLLSDLGLVGTVLFFTPFLMGFIYTAKQFLKVRKNNDTWASFITFSFYFQLFFFLSSVFEGYFQEEILVFLLFLVQILTYQKQVRNYYDEEYNS